MNKSKSKTKLLVIILILIAVIAAGLFGFYKHELTAVSSTDDKTITVDIASGSGAYDIISALDKAGLIRNAACAKLYVRLAAPSNLQANTYLLNKTMSLPQMLNIIENGTFKYIVKTKFTIIEGSTYDAAAESISKALNIKKSAIISKWSNKEYLNQLMSKYWFLSDDILKNGLKCPLEGFLYPETYYVTGKDPSIESVTEQILDVTNSQLTPLKSEISSMNMTPFEFVTFASVVENESLFDNDKPKIAGVFINRLNKGMNMQSDITVLYALGKKTVNVSLTDLKVKSGYNTYLNTGLPIGPVSNPSAATMKACANYEHSDYYYFFATKDGKVIYSKTYAEHQKAVSENQWY